MKSRLTTGKPVTFFYSVIDVRALFEETLHTHTLSTALVCGDNVFVLCVRGCARALSCLITVRNQGDREIERQRERERHLKENITQRRQLKKNSTSYPPNVPKYMPIHAG